MDFQKMLRECQLEKHMSNAAFAKSIGMSRTWLQLIYAKNPNIRKHMLSDLTIYSLNEKLNIPIKVMDEYNDYVRELYGIDDDKWED